MKVQAKRDLTIEGFNAKSKRGNQLRKGRQIKKGQIFEIKREFISNGFATHGTPCLEIRGQNGEIYQVIANDFKKL